DVDVFHHAELGDGPVDLGVLHAVERPGYLLGARRIGRGGHGFMLPTAQRRQFLDSVVPRVPETVPGGPPSPLGPRRTRRERPRPWVTVAAARRSPLEGVVTA